MNPAFLRRLGSCAEAALGRRLWDLSPGTSSNLLSEALRRVIATGSGERLEHADDAWGGRFDSRLYATPAGIY